MAISLVVAGAGMSVLLVSTRTEKRDQSYAQELQSAQAALGRMIHDLREATSFPVPVEPWMVEFQTKISGTTYNVEYNCKASDTLGGSYTRCARTQALAPAAPPAATASSSPPLTDIQHVRNNPTNTADGNGYSTFCNASGTAVSGSVFFVENPNMPNPDTAPAACDENYEANYVAVQPDYIQVRVQVPASGDQSSGGLTHSIVLQAGTYLPNLDSGG